MFATESESNATFRLFEPIAFAAIPTNDRAALAADRPFAVEVRESMVGNRLSRKSRRVSRQQPPFGAFQQSPRTEHAGLLGQQIPVQERMIVDQNRKARHGEFSDFEFRISDYCITP